MNNRLGTILILGIGLLAACTSAEQDQLGSGELASFELTEQGLGAAKLGMSIGELETALGDEFTIERRSEVRHSVRYNDEPIYSVFFLGSDDSIDVIRTVNERVSTSDGLMPGMTLGDAVELLGEPEVIRLPGGIEQIRFPNAETDVLITASGSGDSVGVYDDPSPTDSNLGVLATGYDRNARITALSITAGSG